MQKADFQKYRVLVREELQLREQLAALETSMYAPKVPHLSQTPAAPGRPRDTADIVARHVELELLYRAKLSELTSLRLAIELAIDSLEDPAERVIMRDRYLMGSSWKSIIAKLAPLGYSERQVYRLHGFALLKLKEV